MDNLTIIIPYYNGRLDYLRDLLQSIPEDLPVIIVDDHSDIPLEIGAVRKMRPGGNWMLHRPETKGYFTGAVNVGIQLCETDVLVLNQDVKLEGTAWLELLAEKRNEYALIGERIKGERADFPYGYVHGVFQFMRRDAIQKAGLMDAENYPLWGASALWQLQICRKGFKSLPLVSIPGLTHYRSGNFGSSIQQLLRKEPQNRRKLIRIPPEVSVVIPCYNYGRFLKDTVNSLIGGPTDAGYMEGQTFQSFEIIIVNDASTDNTHEICQELCDPWKGIRYVQLQKNVGTAAAYNAGIKASTGKYITCMSADDMRESWGIEALYKEIIKNPNALVYDNYREFRNGARGEVLQTAPYDFNILLRKNMVPTQVMFSREAWRRVGGYPENFGDGREDWAFAIAMGRMGYCGVKIDNPGYLYRRHGNNRTLRNTSSHEWNQYFRAKLKSTFPDVYQGRYPEMCCGKKDKPSAPRSSSRSAQQTSQVQMMTRSVMMEFPDMENMVLIEYVGNNVGSTRWGGPKLPSKRTYVFGNNLRDKQKMVAVEDKPWFLAKRDQSGTNLFREVALPLHVDQQPVAETVTPNGNDGEEELEPEVEKIVQTINESATVRRVIDPENFTIKELMEMQLTDEAARDVYEREEKGKNRQTLITYLRDNFRIDE